MMLASKLKSIPVFSTSPILVIYCPLGVDQRSSDSVLDTKLWFRIEELFGRAYLGGEMEDLRRNGRLEEFQTEASLRRYTLQLGIGF